MAAYDFKKEEDVAEFLKNLHIEYQFGCLSEKNPEVCHLLGEYNEIIKKDYTTAINLFKKNCDEYKFGKSCTRYGAYKFTGRACEKDNIEAFQYMKKGCDLNDSTGCLNAGAFAISKEELEPSRESQVLLGIKLLQKACNSNEEKACFNLSGIFLHGIEGYVERNPKEAYLLSLKCCEFGNPYACANLSVMHKKGDGVQQSEDLAKSFRTRADQLLKELKRHKPQTTFQQGIDQ